MRGWIQAGTSAAALNRAVKIAVSDIERAVDYTFHVQNSDHRAAPDLLPDGLGGCAGTEGLTYP